MKIARGKESDKRKQRERGRKTDRMIARNREKRKNGRERKEWARKKKKNFT